MISLPSELVKEILTLGMPAEHADRWHPPGIGNLLIMGEFISMDEGSKAKRMLIGFGAGASSLQTHVVGYQFTDQGLNRLGDAVIETVRWENAWNDCSCRCWSGGRSCWYVCNHCRWYECCSGAWAGKHECSRETNSSGDYKNLVPWLLPSDGWIPAYKVKK